MPIVTANAPDGFQYTVETCFAGSSHETLGCIALLVHGTEASNVWLAGSHSNNG
ncbi:hypothetical protein PGT21_037302 [Puccinia graminis f. sp. tritici]|uniref:Uncharacterized protein n=1 Tax=Puccinia graminis f. sp. tritici TaxID=56615 RepID=A0A5B0N8R1_PUCGR|nr:hypothetical protein PGTUg99_027841 [Puccinia graminis f. sp. tritici]KAA1084814.1 hypothetical protein PGT21_035720 [Puccinia graminis f. sp. tritici]KAA1114044.1 hypothetical protein PGTUg99_011132 [Puccinia graminis f. sp. tritici]KAA1120241.1 hypothetical protein PGT21_037302 [Puccinia graminis f. sp. tritici]